MKELKIESTKKPVLTSESKKESFYVDDYKKIIALAEKSKNFEKIDEE